MTTATKAKTTLRQDIIDTISNGVRVYSRQHGAPSNLTQYVCAELQDGCACERWALLDGQVKTAEEFHKAVDAMSFRRLVNAIRKASANY